MMSNQPQDGASLSRTSSLRRSWRTFASQFIHLSLAERWLRLTLVLAMTLGAVLASWLVLTPTASAQSVNALATSSSTSSQQHSRATTAPGRTHITSLPITSKPSPIHPHTLGGVKPLVDSTNAQDGLGDQPFYTYTSFALTDQLKLKVNVADGNLLLESSDYTMHGTGLDLNISSYYNSRPNYNFYQYEHGKGWTSNLCSSQYLDESNPTSGITFFGPSDTSSFFAYKGAGPNGTTLFSDAPGINATLVGNADGSYTLTYHKTGEKLTFGAYSSVDTIQDKNGNTISCGYTADGSGNQQTATITDTKGRVLTAAHDGVNHITSLTDPSGRSVVYGYDSNNHLTSITDRTGKKTIYGYTGDQLTSITDPLSHTTQIQYVYDSNSGIYKVSQITRAAGGTITYVYHQIGDSACSGIESGNDFPCTVVTDQNNHSTTYLYAFYQWQVTYTQDALGHISTKTFDSTNYNVTSAQDALLNTSNFTFDANNNLTSEKDGTGVTSSAGYSDTTHPYYPTSQTDTQGNQAAYTYTSAGNLSTTKSGQNLSQTQTYTYNGNGTIATATDANNHLTTYGYDGSGNLTSITFPSPLGKQTMTYDAFSRVSSLTDGTNKKTTYTYDAVDRLSTVTYSDTSTLKYVYDGDGNITTVTDRTGTTTFGYDKNNRETSKSAPGAPTITSTYDLVGNLLSLTDGSGTTNYHYNAVNLSDSLTEPAGAKTTFSYNANNQKTGVTYPNHVTMTIVYDNGGRETSIVSKNNGGTTLTSYSYNYTNPASNKLTDQRYSMTNTAGNVTKYSYDATNELTNAAVYTSGNTQIGNYAYTYDANGNRLTAQTALGGPTTTYSYNLANELTSSMVSGATTTYSYDGNGNQTGSSAGLSVSYNVANQATMMNGTSNTYSGADQSQRVKNGSATAVYTQLGLDSETSSGSTTYYIRCSCSALAGERTSSGTYYYLFDGLGSIVGLTDSNGTLVNTYQYDPFGNITSSTGTVTNPWRFAGGYYDSNTHFYKFGIRYYDPSTGRWTQRDPVGGSLQETLKANPFVYAGNDPVNEVDPSGRIAVLVAALALIGIGVAVGIIGNLFLLSASNPNPSASDVLKAAFVGGVAGGATAASSLLFMNPISLSLTNIGGVAITSLVGSTAAGYAARISANW